MATDIDELLIFKLRGMEKPKKQQKAEEAKPAKKEEIKQQQRPEPQIATKPAGVQKPETAASRPPEYKPIFSSIAQQKPVQPQKPPVLDIEKPAQAKPGQPERFVVIPKEEPAAQKKPYFGEMFTKPQAAAVPARKSEEEVLVESMKRKGVIAEPEAAAPTFSGKPLSGKESMQAAKGRTCTNHPWRGAYAVCDFCRRPFCYADLIEYGKHFYCLEDIDRATSGAAREKIGANAFTKIAGFVFIANSLILLYFTMPQLEFIWASASKISSSALLAAIWGNYSVPLLNAVLAVVGMLAAILLFITEDERAMYLAGLVAALFLIGISYEYLNSYLYYTLLVSVIALVEIVLLTYGRVSAVTTSYSTDLGPPDIEWPRLETF
ncbi:MAG: hypothetical protein KGH61_05610 [Candidatus Micrarchaeota archaeon]|nr:hypothetical protein [Candidatus Micrarchaeota archaeon]MDE1848391.1 hypothetical protein [Candidatus Micrarchaeota archaeon]MDE1864447.1 hypothetical protein [Candidatus Micrarchaeota archaeon]